MSTLLDKFEEHEKEFISVSETLNLIMQATKGTLEQAKDYLLVIKLNEHVPVLYKDKKRLEFKSKSNDDDGNGFNSTYSALTSELKGNEYFSIKALNEFRPLDEYDIFAHRRGYHYVAQHSVGRFKTGAYVIGLDDSRAEQLLCTGAIEKLTIKEVEDRESKKVKFLTKQLSKVSAELAASKTNSNEPIDDRSEKSYLNTIGLLLELMTSPRAEGGQAPFPSESDIIARVNVKEKSVYGQGKSTLEERFRDAKLILADTRKKP